MLRAACFRRGCLVAAIYKVREGFDRGVFVGASCAFGVFDGVHVGHRYLIDRACETACASGGRAIALTFDIDPDEAFRPGSLKKLMSNEERLAMLTETGVDAVVVLPFTKSFASLTPFDFLNKTFQGTVPAFLHVGCDFRFGAKAAGTTEELRSWGSGHGMRTCAHDLKSADGEPVTATRIRGLLLKGNVEEAEVLLGRPYSVSGEVEPGRGEGAQFGFRTANLRIPDQLRALGDGVYAAYARVGGERYKAAVNVGIPATFADTAKANCEVHLLDFEGDLYGKRMTVEFKNWLRPMRKFDDLTELVATVEGNIAWVRENL